MVFLMAYFYSSMPSPVGLLTLVSQQDKLVAILWENDRPLRVKLGEMQHAPHSALLMETVKQLQEYFQGKRQQFDLPLRLHGTVFQQQVWQALQGIPFAGTRSYSQIAQQIGNPKAVRAVGAANGRNPLSIVVPCHRVIGQQGQLTGFAGGLAAKKYLLALEQSVQDQPLHQQLTLSAL
jgi:methylated-DNA-[protein]-cysteine S-methyltransferase